MSENDALHGRHLDPTKASPELVRTNPKKIGFICHVEGSSSCWKASMCTNQDTNPEVFLDGLTYD